MAGTTAFTALEEFLSLTLMIYINVVSHPFLNNIVWLVVSLKRSLVVHTLVMSNIYRVLPGHLLLRDCTCPILLLIQYCRSVRLDPNPNPLQLLCSTEK